MKKILLGTTTLVGAALVAQAALADAPKVTVGGFSDFEAGIVSDDQDANQRNHAFRTDNEISFKVDGKSDSGLGYGAEIWLEADVDSDADESGSSDQLNQGINASKTFVYVEGTWGRFEGGANLGPDQTLKVDAASIARATGGIDGDWRLFANNTANNPYIATPDLPLNYGYSSGISNVGLGDESQENLNKITYYTPKWSGFQAGISYIPSDQERGQFMTSATRVDNTAGGTFGTNNTVAAGQADNIWVGGLNWMGQWDQIGIALAATAERGNAESALNEDLWAWQVGGKLSYMGFSIAGSFADWGDSLRLKAENANDTDFWTVGGAYEYGPYGISVTYLRSSIDQGPGIQENKLRNWTVGADYKLAPGLTPFVELSFYDMEAAGAAPDDDNEGHVFLIGTSLNF